MKKIGFVDYYLDEWHARMYPGWIRQCGNPAGFDVTLAWEQMPKSGGKTGAQWCAERQVAQAASIEQVVRECDCIVVLSPDNMEMHETLADLPLRSGKPVYIDKTLAPSAAAARRLFAKARKFGTPLCSFSALRFSPDLRAAMAEKIAGKPVQLAIVRGPNDFAKQYAVHAVEMLVMLLGRGARRVMHGGSAATPHLLVDYAGGRRGIVELNAPGFQLFVEYGKAEKITVDVKQDFWNGSDGFIPNLLRFFDTREAPVLEADTVEVMALIEAGTKAMAKPYAWVRVPAGGQRR